MIRRALIALCLVLAGCDGHGDDAGTIVLHGNVDIRQVSLAFEEAGRITMLGAEEGDRVKAGAVLARLDALEARAMAANPDLATARVAGGIGTRIDAIDTRRALIQAERDLIDSESMRETDYIAVINATASGQA